MGNGLWSVLKWKGTLISFDRTILYSWIATVHAAQICAFLYIGTGRQSEETQMSLPISAKILLNKSYCKQKTLTVDGNLYDD